MTRPNSLPSVTVDYTPTEDELRGCDLFDQIEAVISGSPGLVALCALGEVMACTIAFVSDDLQGAYRVIDQIPEQLQRVMRERWTQSRELRAKEEKQAANMVTPPRGLAS